MNDLNDKNYSKLYHAFIKKDSIKTKKNGYTHKRCNFE